MSFSVSIFFTSEENLKESMYKTSNATIIIFLVTMKIMSMVMMPIRNMAKHLLLLALNYGQMTFVQIIDEMIARVG